MIVFNAEFPERKRDPSNWLAWVRVHDKNYDPKRFKGENIRFHKRLQDASRG